MNYLGIDYGRKKIGLSFADGPLAEPLKVLRIENLSRKAGELGIEELLTVIRDLQINVIVIGISEGEMEKEIREFGAKLKKTLSKTVIPAYSPRGEAGPQSIKIAYHDETLSTKEAQRLAIESGKKQKKRREMEDAYSATFTLQNYLDSL